MTDYNQSDMAMDLVMDIPLQLSVELGRQLMTVAEVLQLGQGSVVELSKAAGEALDIYLNDRLVARGEAVTIGDRYGIRITEIQSAKERASQAGVSSFGSEPPPPAPPMEG
jgi:flagellar motor switch protein FliN/FliY